MRHCRKETSEIGAAYGGTVHLVITADAVGSNSPRTLERLVTCPSARRIW